MKCPLCNSEGAEECANEVDIGVGVQKFIWGYSCPKCGDIPVCPDCGALGNAPDDHFQWCEVTKEGDA